MPIQVIPHVIPHSVRLIAAFALLAACEDSVVSRSSGFQKSYSQARTALEQGNYDGAVSRYAALIPNSGPLESRLRLEYSHALLRDNRFDEAARVSAGLAGNLRGSDKAAALAVVGAAKHEMALQAMQAGDFGGQTETHLNGARAAIDEMLKIDAGMDPHGAMASRRKDIAGELKLVRQRG